MRRGLIFSFGILATAMTLIFIDQDVSRWFSADEQTSLRLAARRITDIGLGEYWFGLAVAVYLLARFLPLKGKFTFHQSFAENLRRWALHLFFGLLGSGILVQALKALIGRQRPHKSDTLDALIFEPLTTDWHFHSLPSGHTQVLFSVATTAALLWPRAAFVLYSAAGLISFTRVMTLQHFISDVIAGAMVGYFGTLLVRSEVRKKIPLPWETTPGPKTRPGGASAGAPS